MRRKREKSDPRLTKILWTLRTLKKNDERILILMAKTRAELGTQMTALGTALQALIDKIAAGGDFQAEFDVVQGFIDKINTTASGL